MERAYDKKLLDFIQNSPSVYHMIAGQKQRLLAAGYTQLLESEAWELRPGREILPHAERLRHPRPSGCRRGRSGAL